MRVWLQEKDPRPEGAPFYDKDTVDRNKKIAEKTNKLCRYTTKLEDILTNHMGGVLPEDQYPWVKAPRRGVMSPSAAGGAGAAAAATFGAHGETVNKYAVDAMYAHDSSTAVRGRRGWESKFARSGEEAVTPTGSPAPDVYSQFLEPAKLRTYEGGRVIVFVLGGITQLECAALDKMSVATKREIVVGSTSLLVPGEFIRELYETDRSVLDEDNYGAGAFPDININITD